jgi:hypothetical protein
VYFDGLNEDICFVRTGLDFRYDVEDTAEFLRYSPRVLAQAASAILEIVSDDYIPFTVLYFKRSFVPSIHRCWACTGCCAGCCDFDIESDAFCFGGIFWFNRNG